MVEPEIEDILDRIAEEVEATITPGFNAPDVVRIIQPQMTHPGFVSRLSLPENIESVQDEVFRQFADEMKTQYELLEADYNEIKHSNRKIKDEMVYRNYLARETQTNFEILIKKLM